MKLEQPYPIGTPGNPWGAEERAQWLSHQAVHRSYTDDVLSRRVINYDARTHGLCMGMTNARFVTTTEVYPDSPRTNPSNCIDAQVAAVIGGLDFVTRQ